MVFFEKLMFTFFIIRCIIFAIKVEVCRQMKCIYCGSMDSKVVDSRQNEDGTSIRRRRECVVCGKRFTTYETVESTPIMVIKKDGSRQAFDLNKIKIGIMKIGADAVLVELVGNYASTMSDADTQNQEQNKDISY